ncbi:MAG: 23S rRNA (uracil(1939)-C(5))-methyltransferase RlmD [Erysipelotrichaceae bacterium]|nr:23S rRNA (uracil(1939)-C(5))-methyltransferase RlmD [Erysipelotrichaceae bacterium]
MLKKNDVVRETIIDITNEGYGVIKVEGFPVFVPDSCIGEVCEIRILKVFSNYAFGKIDKLLEPSPKRITPICPLSKRCGGCSFGHIDYIEECHLKTKAALQTIRKISKIDLDTVEVLPTIPSNKEVHYRNKAQYPIGKDKEGNIKIGFYAPRSHDVVDCNFCYLQPEFFSDIVEVVKKFIEDYNISVYDEIKHMGLVRHLYIRYGEATNEVMVSLIINGRKLPHQEEFIQRLLALPISIKSIVLDYNEAKSNVILGMEYDVIYGEKVIMDILCGNEIEIAPLSFYQVNREQAERLYNVAKEFADLQGNELLIDLYCGAGTIGLSMASDVRKLIGVEIIEEAIEAAKRNASRNEYHNTEFYAGDASKLASDLAKRELHSDVIVVDPPRKGITPEVIDACVTMAPERIVYVSCNVATLARDIALLKEKGYRTTKLRFVDLFPRTVHLEAVALLTRDK